MTADPTIIEGGKTTNPDGSAAQGRAVKRKGRRTDRSTNDVTIIRLCVQYAQYNAAFIAGFDADPDGNSEYAATLGNYSRRRDLALVRLSNLKATTPDAICAKAKALLILMKEEATSPERCWDTNAEIPQNAVRFIKSVAADVAAFTEEQ